MCMHNYEPELDRFKLHNAWGKAIIHINQTEVQNASIALNSHFADVVCIFLKELQLWRLRSVKAEEGSVD